VKWLLLIPLVLLVVVVLMVLIGLMLPSKHHATRMARFKQPPEVVFSLITGPQDWRGVTTTELSSGGGSSARRWREQSGRHAITFEETVCEPPWRYQSRIADPNLPFGGTWTWEITPGADGGCACRITEDGEVRNPLFRFVSQVIVGHTKTIETYLQSLGRKFNEPVTIEG
jgi:hypothetical protein